MKIFHYFCGVVLLLGALFTDLLILITFVFLMSISSTPIAIILTVLLIVWLLSKDQTGEFPFENWKISKIKMFWKHWKEML